jgi:hypothetical protein
MFQYSDLNESNKIDKHECTYADICGHKVKRIHVGYMSYYIHKAITDGNWNQIIYLTQWNILTAANVTPF